MIAYFQSISEEGFIKEVEAYEDHNYSGSYGALVTPKSVYYNGATYLTARKDSDSKNSPLIIKYSNGQVETASVGTIDNSDPLQHAHPAVIVKDGEIYVFSVNGHGQDIKIWKSNVNESITDGFTLHYTIVGKFGYCNPRLLPDGRIVILIRLTATGDVNNYAQAFLISAVNDYTTWTEKQTTYPNHNSTKNRHYPSAPYYYGTNSWYYFGISLRNESQGVGGEDYFAQAIYKTQDFSTFYNLAETWSKNVDVDGVMTAQEIEDNLTLVGTKDLPNMYVKPMQFIVVNDVVYNCFYDKDSGYFKFMKIDGATRTDYPCQITGIDTTANFSYKMRIYYNGNNLVIFSGGNIYGLDMNFDNLNYFDQYYASGDSNSLDTAMIPTNFDEVSGVYLLAGSTEQGVFPYIETDEKFTI
jgi:hypothetical protein